MKNAVRKAAYVLLALIMTVSMWGCLLESGTAENQSHGDLGVLIDDEALTQTIIRTPLTIVSKSRHRDGCLIRVPYVCNPGMELLNFSLSLKLMGFASDCEANQGVVD